MNKEKVEELYEYGNELGRNAKAHNINVMIMGQKLMIVKENQGRFVELLMKYAMQSQTRIPKEVLALTKEEMNCILIGISQEFE